MPPSSSGPQHRLMEASAHGAPWAAAKVKPSVAKDFVAADKASGKKFFGPAKGKKQTALSQQRVPQQQSNGY